MTPQERVEIIDAMALKDAHYKTMLKKVACLEQGLMDALKSLPYETDDIVWSYIMYCEDMSRYVLQLACAKMVFPEESGQTKKEEAANAEGNRLYLLKKNRPGE